SDPQGTVRPTLPFKKAAEMPRCVFEHAHQLLVSDLKIHRRGHRRATCRPPRTPSMPTTTDAKRADPPARPLVAKMFKLAVGVIPPRPAGERLFRSIRPNPRCPRPPSRRLRLLQLREPPERSFEELPRASCPPPPWRPFSP